MENNENKNSRHSRILRFSNWVIKRRWAIIAGSIVLAMVTGYGGQNLTFNNDYHIYFDEDNPQVMAFDRLQEKYTKDDNVFIVIQPESGNVFTKETLVAIEDLEQMAWQTPFSTRVDALSNFQHTRADGDDMYVESLAANVGAMTERDIESIKEIALNEALLVDRLINQEGSVTAVNVTVNLPADSMEAAMDVMNYARAMVADWEDKYPGHNTYISGVIMLNGSFAESSMNDMGTLVPGMFLIIILLVLISTRSISGMITALLVVMFSIMTAMGMAGWAGVGLSGPSASAPTMIMTLAIADSIHLLITMLQLMRAGMPKNEAISESIRVNFMPVTITSITTVIGFLTLNFVEGTPFRDLGNITAVGVGAAFLFSMFLLPALMSVLPVKVKVKDPDQTGFSLIDRFANLVIANHKLVLGISVLAVIGLSVVSLKNELNNEFVKFFDERVEFRTDTDFISENLTGIYNIEYSLGAGEPDGISNPEYLAKLDEFDTWFKTQPEVMHVNTFSETMKRVNLSMHGDSLQHYKIPNARDEAAQYLLL
ncbi:MAG: MMPL family transporter, partial [Flavobacteriales bacterium]|nr:MMPL family transporter [Flavobacteriales bacterium]